MGKREPYDLVSLTRPSVEPRFHFDAETAIGASAMKMDPVVLNTGFKDINALHRDPMDTELTKDLLNIGIGEDNLVCSRLLILKMQVANGAIEIKKKHFRECVYDGRKCKTEMDTFLASQTGKVTSIMNKFGN